MSTQKETTSNPPGTSAFFLLPSEIRLNIYRQALPPRLLVRRDFHLCECRVYPAPHQSSELCESCILSEAAAGALQVSWNLLLTCRQIYTEAKPAFDRLPVELHGSGYHDETVGFLNGDARQQLPDHVKAKVRKIVMGQASAFSCLVKTPANTGPSLLNFPFHEYPRLRVLEASHRGRSRDPRWRRFAFGRPAALNMGILFYVTNRPVLPDGQPLQMFSAGIPYLLQHQVHDLSSVALAEANAIMLNHGISIRYPFTLGFAVTPPQGSLSGIVHDGVRHLGAAANASEPAALTFSGQQRRVVLEYECVLEWDGKWIVITGLPDHKHNGFEAELAALQQRGPRFFSQPIYLPPGAGGIAV